VSQFASGLYGGVVTHQRFRPRAHRLRYSLFQMLFDLDELPNLASETKLFAHNRFNLFSFHDCDHGDGAARPLRAWVEASLHRAGVELAGGAIRLLCMPRLFGHVFNPISIYFCYTADGALAAMIYEVNNTFGERHSYVIPLAPDQHGPIRQTCAKAFHVSPFMDMEMTYDFELTEPGDRVVTLVRGRDLAGLEIIAACFAGRRQAFGDRALFQAIFAYPLLTLKVVAAIHWEALKLLLKGVRLRARPAAPGSALTVTKPSRAFSPWNETSPR
jgi:hypothetical protein